MYIKGTNVYHVFILYHIVVINMLGFKNSTWRLIHTYTLIYNMVVDLTAHISKWKNMLYSIWIFLFINVGQLSVTFLILFQKLCKAAYNGDVDLVQDCLQKGADVQSKDDFLVSI